MRVYNISQLPVDFHGHTIAPNGGYGDYPELDQYIPSRDRKLEEDRVLSFGFLPSWWLAQQELLKRPEPQLREEPVAVIQDVVKDLPPPLPAPSGWVEKPVGKKRLKG